VFVQVVLAKVREMKANEEQQKTISDVTGGKHP
jgi:hypothetical protein